MLLDDVKLALRVNHNLLDAEYERVIDTAKAEIARAGVNPEKLTNPDKLITNAIVTFVKADNADDLKDREGYYESFQYQLDNIRKTGAYV